MEIRNPIIGADMPDPDLLRIGDTYYMVSTTMFYVPGAPVLKSKDLCHWEIVSYIFDVLEDNEIYRLECLWERAVGHKPDKIPGPFLCLLCEP